MRITFLQREANFSGGNRMIAAYAQFLKDQGHQVLVVSARPPHAKPARQFLDTIRRIARAPGDGRSWLDATDIEHRVVAPPIDADDVPSGDVVVATWWETAEWASALPARCGAPAYFIQGAEWTIPSVPSLRAKQTWRLPLHKIVIADFLADIARRDFGDDDVSLVPNGFDPSLFYAEARPKNEVPSVGLMTVGDIPIKGWDVTHAALLRAKEAVPELRGYAFGRHPAPESHPLPEWFEFEQSPSPEALRALYGRCDVFVHGARVEGYGLPVLEALACRTPVAATRAGAVPELLATGGGIAVNIEDSAALADAIVTIATESPTEWEARSETAAQMAASLKLDRACRRFEQALEAAAEKSRSGAYAQAGGAAVSARPPKVRVLHSSEPYVHWTLEFEADDETGPTRDELVHPALLAQLEKATGTRRLIVDPLARDEGTDESRSPDFARDLPLASEVSYAEPPLRRVFTLYVSGDGQPKPVDLWCPDTGRSVRLNASAFLVPVHLDAPVDPNGAQSWQRVHYYVGEFVERETDKRRYYTTPQTNAADRLRVHALNTAEAAQAGQKELVRRLRERYLNVE